MGRRTDIDNDDDEQQSTSSTSSSSTTIRIAAHESQTNSNRNLDDDPLIHDTILPHRKRVRRDTLLSIQQQHYVQPQQSESMTTCCKIEDVSLF